jgi:hypothetical protein
VPASAETTPPPAATQAASPTSPLKLAGWITVGAGAAALAGGAIIGALALSARSTLANAIANDPRCAGGYPDGSCDPSARAQLGSEEESALNRATVSTVLFVAGGALVVTGISLVVLAPSPARTASVHVRASAGGIAVGGAF